MKGEGTAHDTDAKHALAHCLQLGEVGVLELITSEVSLLPPLDAGHWLLVAGHSQSGGRILTDSARNERISATSCWMPIDLNALWFLFLSRETTV